MHQHTHHQDFTPILHRSLIILPAPTQTQDSKLNTHLPGESTESSFAPVSAFYRATQKSFSSTKRGRWGALHVCIAWKIYYNEQLKKIQQKQSGHRRELAPEYPATTLHDSEQRKESEQDCCIKPNLNSPCGHSAETTGHSSRSYPPDPYTSSPCYSRKREKLDWGTVEHSQSLHWREKFNEKEKHWDQQTDTAKDFLLRDKTSDNPAVTTGLNGKHAGSTDRKRPLECDSFIKTKRVKQEIVDVWFDSLHTDPTQTHPSSHAVPVQHVNTSDLSILYPGSSSCNVPRAPGGLVSYPGAKMHPCQTASWEPVWDIQDRFDVHLRQNVLKDYSWNTCKAARIPLVAQRQKEALHSFFTPPCYFPLALRQQETGYLGGGDFQRSRHDSCHLRHYRHRLPHPGFLARSYLGP